MSIAFQTEFESVVELVSTHYNDCDVGVVRLVGTSRNYSSYRADVTDREGESRIVEIRANERYGAWFPS